MLIALLPSISARCLVGLALGFAQIIEAQEDLDMSSDSHFREELGVNQYTTPSIEQLFNTLDSLKPIPIQELTRPPRAIHLDNRVKFALSFGVLIGDAFLAVEGEETKAIEPVGREMLRRAKGLGVQQRVSRHSKQLLELAKRSDWSGLRKELIVTQKDVETAMLDYYLQRLDTLSTPLKSTVLISQIISGLKEVRQKLADTPTFSQQDVSGIQSTAHNLVALIEADNSTATATRSD
jgi:hypothetical protein